MSAVGATGMDLRLGNTPNTVALTAVGETADELGRLLLRFRTGRPLKPGAGEIELDDLLLNLNLLTRIPPDWDVRWEPRLAELARDSTIGAKIVEQRISEGDSIEVDAEELVLGENWSGALTDFQTRDIRRLLALKHGANFSVPGAGKTRVTLGVYNALRSQGEVEQLLIVGPKSAYSAWFEENDASFDRPLDMAVWNESESFGSEAYILNYERLQRALSPLMRWIQKRPTLLVLDEAHRMKLGADGVYGAACLALGPFASRRLILTGTPAPNGSRDLENLLGFVWPGSGKRAVSRAVAGGSLQLASKALGPLFTRTTKRELALPEVNFRQIPLDLPPVHREIYDALLGQYSARVTSNSQDFEAIGKVMVYMMMAATSPGLLAVGSSKYEPLSFRVPPIPVAPNTELYDLMQDLPNFEMAPKYQEVLAIVNANAAAGRKTLVWSTFIRSLTTLHQLLSQFSPALVHGGTENREEEIARFKSDPDCLVLLSNPATLGEGISLHHVCHDAIYVDRDFAAGRYLQSVDRIHRLGLARDTETNVTVLTSNGTIDEVIGERLKSKVEFMSSILDDPDVRQLGDLDEAPSVGAAMSSQDLQSIVEHFHGNSE